jgi:ubiquinone/menaquinone biosynthesis C-methylase UbiE
MAVLDCGCGVGVLLRDLVQQYSQVYGLDISFDSLQLVGSLKLKGLVVGDAERLPYRDSVFDAIVLRSALHHLPDVDRALQELRRTLKHGGTLILAEPCGDNWLVRWGRRKFSRRQERYFRAGEIEEYLVRSGFVCTLTRRTGYLAFAFSFLFREQLSRLAQPAWFYRLCVNLFIFVDNLLSHIPGVRTMNLGVLAVGKAVKSDLLT